MKKFLLVICGLLLILFLIKILCAIGVSPFGRVNGNIKMLNVSSAEVRKKVFDVAFGRDFREVVLTHCALVLGKDATLCCRGIITENALSEFKEVADFFLLKEPINEDAIAMTALSWWINEELESIAQWRTPNGTTIMLLAKDESEQFLVFIYNTGGANGQFPASFWSVVN